MIHIGYMPLKANLVPDPENMKLAIITGGWKE
jgi:hypothetical protein